MTCGRGLASASVRPRLPERRGTGVDAGRIACCTSGCRVRPGRRDRLVHPEAARRHRCTGWMWERHFRCAHVFAACRSTNSHDREGAGGPPNRMPMPCSGCRCMSLQQGNQPFHTFQGIRRPSRVRQSRLPCMDCGRHCSGAWPGVARTFKIFAPLWSTSRALSDSICTLPAMCTSSKKIGVKAFCQIPCVQKRKNSTGSLS